MFYSTALLRSDELAPGPITGITLATATQRLQGLHYLAWRLDMPINGSNWRKGMDIDLPLPK